MIPDQFLYCRICNEVHHVTPFDVRLRTSLEGMTVREIFIDDRRQFIDRHFDHEIEALKKCDSRTVFPSAGLSIR